MKANHFYKSFVNWMLLLSLAIGSSFIQVSCTFYDNPAEEGGPSFPIEQYIPYLNHANQRESITAAEAKKYEGKEWRLEVAADEGGLPFNFRYCGSAFDMSNNAELQDKDYVPTREGFDNLNISGSSRFSLKQLEALTEWANENVKSKTRIIVDLRQETHGFINGNHVSWYGYINWSNIGKQHQSIINEENALFGSLQGKTITMGKISSSNNYVMTNPKTFTIEKAEDAMTEREAVKKQGWLYYRITALDHVFACDAVLDQFLEFYRTLPRDVWLHFHCQAGRGRTTSFMVFYDMLRNPDVPLKDILYRHTLIGGVSLTYKGDRPDEQEWRRDLFKEISVMVPLFYQYVQDNKSTNYAKSFSQWKREVFPGLYEPMGPQYSTADVTDRSIVIFYENDVHGGIDGYPMIAGLRDAVAQSDTAWAGVVSSGDYLSGGVACTLEKGKYIASLIGSVKYDALTLGNHEFDWGVPRLLELIPQFKAPVVCVNLFEYGKNETLTQPYVIRQYGDKSVAFVGVVTPESMRSEAYSFFTGTGEQIYDLRTNQVYTLVQNAVDEARKKGADYVVVLSHLGEDESETGVNSSGLVAATTGIDVVLDGHTHHVVPRAEMLNKEGKTVVVSQTGEQFHHIGKLVIKDGKFMTELLPTQDNPAVTGYVSATVTNALNTVKADMETVTGRVLGTSAYELTVNDGSGHRIVRNAETNLGDFAADAFLNEVGGDIGLINGGGVRNSIPAGSITYGDVLGAFPFLNVICQVEATGAEIKAMLKKCTENTAVREDGSFPQVSGIKFTIHSASKTVSDIQVYNKEASEYQPLDDARKYIIATTDYVYQGGFYRTLQQCPMVKTTTIANSEAIANYLGKLNTTGDTYLNSQGRINIVND